MLRRILTAAALVALLISPALSQSGTPAAKPQAGKAQAGKAQAGKAQAAKTPVAKKGKKTAAKAKATRRQAGKKGSKRRPVKLAPLTPEKKLALYDEAAALSEDVIILALEGKPPKVAEKVGAIRRLLPMLQRALGSEAYEEMAGHTARMEQDALSNDVLTAALDAAEAFKTISAAIDAAGARTSPLDVSMYDYVSFKLTILAASPQPDWPMIAAAARESHAVWARLDEKIGDAAVQKQLEAIQEGLRNAVVRKDIQGVKLAAQKQLSAGDVLDRHFKNAAKPPNGETR